jgi:hypothetical protein
MVETEQASETLVSNTALKQHGPRYYYNIFTEQALVVVPL